MSRPRWWRRADGTVLSRVDLTHAIPIMPDELDDVVRLIDLAEEWLRLDEHARDLLDDWLAASATCPGRVLTAWDVIDQVGTLGVKLHRLIRAGAPGAGPVHPPAG